MQFSILDLDDPEWTSRLSLLPSSKRDVHFYPQMLAPYAKVYGWKANAALTVDGDSFILQPLLITHDLQLRHAYNFGGPIGTSEMTSELVEAHSTGVKTWASALGVKAEFCTLNPFVASEQPTSRPAERVKETVYIDLHKMKIRGTTRRLANKAQGAGVQLVRPSQNSHNIKIFNAIYTATMDRAQAKEYWYTPPAFFEAVVEFTGGDILFALYQDTIEAGCLVITPPSDGNGVAYYHYAGSYNRHPKLGINHMMVLAAAEYCKSLGCDKLHLGGGVTAADDDSLLTFKAGFSDLRAPVYTYKCEV